MTPFSVWADDRRLAALADDARPALVLTQDGLRVDWANAAGARLLGARLGDIAAGGLVLGAGTLSGQIANLSPMLAQSGAIRLERLRFSGVGRLEALACACRWIGTPDGEKAVLVTALDVPRWLRVVSTRPAPTVDVLTGDLDPVVTPSALRDARDVTPVASGTSLPLPDPSATWRWASSEPELSENGTGTEPETEQAGPAPHELDAPSDAETPAAADAPVTPEEHAAGAVVAETEQAAALLDMPIADTDVAPEPVATEEVAALVEDLPAEATAVEDVAEPVAVVDLPVEPAPVEDVPEPVASVEAVAVSGLSASNVEPASDLPAPDQVVPPQTGLADMLAGSVEPVAETITSEAVVSPVAAEPAAVPAPVRSMIRRFVFQSDAEGRFTRVSPELAEALGAGAGDWVGRSATDLMTDGFDREGRLARAFASRDTFTGLQLDWPNSGALAITPIDISALPVFDRTRTFQGFRGFGVCRPPRPMTDEEALADMSAAMEARATTSVEEPAASLPDAPAAAAEPAEAARADDTPVQDAKTVLDEAVGVAMAVAETGTQGTISTDDAIASAPETVSEASDKQKPVVPADDAIETDGAGEILPHVVEENPIHVVDAMMEAPSLDPFEAATVDVPEPVDEYKPVDEAEPVDVAALLDAHEPVVTVEASAPEVVDPLLPEVPALVAGETVKDELSGDAIDAPVVDGTEPVAFEPAEKSGITAFAESEGLEPVALPSADNDPVPPVVAVSEAVDEAAHEASASVAAEPAAPAEEPPVFPMSSTVIAFADIRDSRGESDPKVVRLRGTRPTTIERVTLSTSERNAFREIARVLGARIEGDTDFPDPPATLAPLADLPATKAPAEAAETMDEPVVAAASGTEEAVLRERGSPVSTALLDRLPVGVIVARGEDLLFANRTLLDLLGYENIDAIGRIGGLARIFAGTGQATLSAGAGHSVLLATADGETVAVDGRMQTAPWNGENALLVTVRRPVDEEAGLRVRSAEEALSAAERRAAELQAVLDTATDGVVIIDGNGSIIGVNRSAEALFGHEAEDVAGQSMLMLFAPESHRAALDYLDGLKRNGVASVLNDGREVTGRVRQGGRVPLFMTIGRLGDGDRFCAVLRDITQFKKAEEELLASKRHAEDASSQKSDFLAKVSHEIRTPLNAIIGFAEVMIEERFGPVGNDRYRAYLKDIHGAGGHVIGLVNDLLDLAKIEAGKLDLTFASVALNDVIEQSVAIMQPQANRDRILIRTALSRSLPNVVADGRTVRQIVLNLLSNSIKFTPQGGQVIVSTTLSEIGEAVMRVRDTGVGMTDKELAVAMEPFRQVGTANRSGGTGLGLPLTKALVEANRASFMIQSTKNTGTLVEVIFPPTRVLAE